MDPIPTTLPPSSSSPSSMSTMLQMECEQLRRHYLNKVNNNYINNNMEEKSHNAWSMEKNSKIKVDTPTVMELQDDLDALSGEVSRVMQSARPPTAPSTFLSYCKSVRTTPTEVSEKEANKHKYKYENNGKKNDNYTLCNNKDKSKKKGSGGIDNNEIIKITHVDDVLEARHGVNNKNIDKKDNEQYYKEQAHTKATCSNNNDNVMMPTTIATADNEDYEYVTDDNLQALSTIKEDHYMSSINAFTIHHVQNTKEGSPHVEAENQLHFLSSSSSLASLELIEEEEEEEEQEAKLKGEKYVKNGKQQKPKTKLSPIHCSNNNVNIDNTAIESNSTQTTPKVKATHDVQRRLGVRSAEIHSPRTISLINANNRDNYNNKTMMTPIRSAIVNNNLRYNKINKISSTDNILSTSPTLPPSKLLVNRLSRSNAAPTNVASSLETALQSLQEQEHKEQEEE